MSSQSTVMAQPVVVHVLCGWCGDIVGGTLVSGTTQCTINTKNTVLDTVAYATQCGSYSTERKKEIHRLHTGTRVVHNNYSGTQHSQNIHGTETFGLPKHQVASTMISVLILSSQHF